MAPFTPYVFLQCPCTDTSTPVRRLGEGVSANEEENDEDERAFDPRAPRSNYSLYPPEHLLYCADCQQIRCPRCALDEIVSWFCPNCLFEVPSGTVKSEGTRCTRSCFQCPLCTAPLSVSSTEAPPEGLGADMAAQSGPYVLNCTYCFWSSQEIGITIEKPNSVYTQLAKIKNGGSRHISAREHRSILSERKNDLSEDTTSDNGGTDPNEILDANTQFANLKTFYQGQLSESSPNSALGFTGDYGYGSPGALSRIMGLYTGGSFAAQKTKSKPGAMREAMDALEGLQIQRSSAADAIAKLKAGGWESTASLAQQTAQMNNARFADELRPVPMYLRTKRSKRCRSCRHILTKPEAKVQNTRFRIRLIALNFIPSITIKPLQPATSPLLTAMKPVQYLLTFKNPLFESVKVSMATPAKTPGRFGSKVTVLCPQFEVGANTDEWDEALREGEGREKRRTKAEASEGQHQAEAGKVWERGRNWVSVVVEVVPASLRVDGPAFMKTDEQQEDDGPLREDEDVLEIPVFIRVEWEADAAETEGGGLATANKDKELREKRELAYWCVLGVGRIAQD